MRIFSYIRPSHSFYPLVTRFREAISSSQYYGLITQKMESRKGIVRAFLRCNSSAPGFRWTLDNLSWSFQYWDDRDPYKFNAFTFFYRGKGKDKIELYEFPSDPALKSIKSFFLRRPCLGTEEYVSARYRVLQYTPSLRLTVLASDQTLDEMVYVCKFKKRSRYQVAYEKLVQVCEAGRKSPLPFSLAAPIKVDHENRMFFQEAKRGKPLSTSINAMNFKNHAKAMGMLHYDLHQLDVQENSGFEFETFLDQLKENISWIILIFPNQGGLLNEIRDTLLTHLPTLDPTEYAYCHGDFVCSNILIEKDQLTVIDFDLALRGDPYSEIGHMVASLKYEVPFLKEELRKSKNMEAFFLEQTVDSYVCGYEEKSARKLNRKRLLWYQMWYEVFYVSLMMKRDRFDPYSYRYVCCLLIELRSKFLKIKSISF